MKHIIVAVWAFLVLNPCIVAGEIPIKSFEEYCKSKNLPEGQQVFVDAVLKNLNTADCAEPQKIINESHELVLIQENLTDITPITGLESLHNVVLESNSIRDISPLSNLQSITRLQLAKNQIRDISPILKLKNLTNLNVSENMVTNIKGVSSLSFLTSLTIHDNYISDLSEISLMTKLKVLYVGFIENRSKPGCGVKMKSTGFADNIKNLVNLHTFHAYNVGIRDPKQFENLVEIEKLDLSCNDLKDASFISGMPDLKLAYLKDNNIEKLAIKSEIKVVKDLDLSGNNLSDQSLDNLGKLTSLVAINISRNKLTDISFVAKMPQLRVLKFKNNLVSDISPLKANQELIDLYAGNNLIETVNFQSLSDYLELIDLRKNFISSIEGLEKFENLLEIYLADNPIDDISPLNNLSTQYTIMLDLSNIGMSDFRNLNTPQTIDLFLNSNNITSISHLPKIENTINLHLENNKIRHLDGVKASFPNLKGLNIRGNPIRTLEGMYKDQLTYLDISYTSLENTNELDSYTKLNSLGVAGLGLRSLNPLIGRRLLSLNASNNTIVDITALKGSSPWLRELNLSNNRIESVAAIKDAIMLKDQNKFDLSNNPLGNVIDKSESNCPTDGSSPAVWLWCGGATN